MTAPRQVSQLAMFAATMLMPLAAAQAQQGQITEYEHAVTVSTTDTASVTAIDPATRRVTLETSDGETRTIKCGSNMANFNQIKVGDQVKAVAMEQVVVFVNTDKAASGEGPADTGVIARAPKGSKPGIFIGRSEEATAKIDAIDRENDVVTLRIADGPPRPVKVSSDVPLTAVKAGDDVNVRLTTGMVLWVQSPTDAAQPAAASLELDDATAVAKAGEDEAVIDTTSGRATVEAIDQENRIVTLKGSGGRTKQIKVGMEAINFDQLKVGDVVRATVAEEVMVAVGKGELPPQTAEGAVVARMRKGGRPGVIIADSDEITGTVRSVNPDERTVTLVEAEGQPRTIKATSTVDLSKLQAGDDVNARVTQALAIVVETP
jgi:Cu/Ag efflux protein CusF